MCTISSAQRSCWMMPPCPPGDGSSMKNTRTFCFPVCKLGACATSTVFLCSNSPQIWGHPDGQSAGADKTHGEPTTSTWRMERAVACCRATSGTVPPPCAAQPNRLVPSPRPLFCVTMLVGAANNCSLCRSGCPRVRRIAAWGKHCAQAWFKAWWIPVSWEYIGMQTACSASHRLHSGVANVGSAARIGKKTSCFVNFCSSLIQSVVCANGGGWLRTTSMGRSVTHLADMDVSTASHSFKASCVSSGFVGSPGCIVLVSALSWLARSCGFKAKPH